MKEYSSQILRQAQDKLTESTGFRRITPWQQLWELLNEEQQRIVRTVFRRMKKRDQEDLCYAMVAYIRFHITRDFPCPFMQVIYLSFIDLVNRANDRDDDTLRYENSKNHKQ